MGFVFFLVASGFACFAGGLVFLFQGVFFLKNGFVFVFVQGF